MTISKKNIAKKILNGHDSFRSTGKYEKKEQNAEHGKSDKVTTTIAESKENPNSTICDDCTELKNCRIFDRDTKMWLDKRLPFVRWVPRYNAGYLLRDIIAGITVGLTAIPQGIAYASVAGVEPQYGLYSTIMPCFIYIVLGGCKDMTQGPTAIMALMTYPYASTYGVAYSILLCFLSGVVILLLSFFQLGFLVDFISLPVTIGFTAAAAFTIASAQIKNFFGLKTKSSNSVIDSWVTAFKNLDKISYPDTILGCCTIVTLLFLKYVKNKSTSLHGERAIQKVASSTLWLIGLSGNAIVVVTGAVFAYFLSQNGVSPFKLTGTVAGGLPSVEIPPFSTSNATFVEMVRNMGSSVIAVPLISIMETIAIGKAFEKGRGVDAMQEMIALGLSNFGGAFVGSMPVAGSFTRSAINSTSGVKTPLGGLFTGLLVLFSLSYLTSLFYYIPKATLAGLIITAMIFMVEYHMIGVIWRTKRTDLIPLCAAFFSCLYFGIEYGMIIGITVNLCFILFGIARPPLQISWLRVSNESVLYLMPKQNILFPAVAHIKEIIIDECKMKDEYGPIVIDGSHVYKIDSTTAKGIASLMADLQTRGQRLILWKWSESATATCLGFEESLKWCVRYDDSLEKIVNEPTRGHFTEYSQTASSEQLTNFSNV